MKKKGRAGKCQPWGGGGSPGLKGGTALKCPPKRKVEINSKVNCEDMGKLYRKDAQIYKNGSHNFTKSEKWNEKGMQTKNVIRRENGFKQYCKSFPKSNKNT